MAQDNQSINSHIEDYLDNFCKLSYAPGFAVLLKGKWGSGKTWFIQKYLGKLKEKTTQYPAQAWLISKSLSKLREKKQNYLYVSLYGMSSVSEIEEAFLQQIIPFLSLSPVALVRTIATQVFKASLKIDLDKDGKNDILNISSSYVNLTEYLTNIEQSILIFDDLERCQISLSKILGYINNFIGSKNFKVIIIANEDILNQTYTYKVIKEKLIGKTFAVSPDFEDALIFFLTKVENYRIREFLINQKQLIENVYSKANYENLRTLNQIILDFERIFEALPEKARINLELLKEVFNLLMILSIEIKRGIILPKSINELKEKYLFRLNNQVSSYPLTNSSTSEVKEETDSLEPIFIKYPDVDFYTLFPDAKWWQVFFDKGILNTQELKELVNNSKYFHYEKILDWEKLWHHYRLSNEEFEDLLNKIEFQYATREFTDPEVVKQITGMFLNFSDAGLYYKSKEEILKDSKLYIDWLKNNAQSNLVSYSLSSTNQNILNRYLKLGFKGGDLKEFYEFCDYLKKVQESAKLNSMYNGGQELLTIMQSNVLKFQEMICLNTSPSQQYQRNPILKYIKETDFVENFLSLAKFEDKQGVCWALSERYSFEEFNKELIEESNWLKSVRDLLLEEAVRSQGKNSGYVIKSFFVPYLDEAIKKLNWS